jgi:hypothetical protein
MGHLQQLCTDELKELTAAAQARKNHQKPSQRQVQRGGVLTNHLLSASDLDPCIASFRKPQV